MGTIGAAIIGFIVGEIVMLITVAFFSSKNIGIRESAKNIQLYCDETDCYECEFRQLDGTCQMRCPAGWTLNKKD